MHCVLSCHEVFADFDGNTFYRYQVVQGVVQGVGKSQTQTQTYLSDKYRAYKQAAKTPFKLQTVIMWHI